MILLELAQTLPVAPIPPNTWKVPEVLLVASTLVLATTVLFPMEQVRLERGNPAQVDGINTITRLRGLSLQMLD